MRYGGEIRDPVRELLERWWGDEREIAERWRYTGRVVEERGGVGEMEK